MRVFVLCGTVSKTRAMAYNTFNDTSRSGDPNCDVQSAPPYCSSDHQGISQIGSLKINLVSSDGAQRDGGNTIPWIVGSPPNANTPDSTRPAVSLTRTVRVHNIDGGIFGSGDPRELNWLWCGSRYYDPRNGLRYRLQSGHRGWLRPYRSSPYATRVW